MQITPTLEQLDQHDRLVRVGFDDDQAWQILAAEVSVHDAEALLQRGCAPGTAMRILAPDEGYPLLDRDGVVERITASAR